MLALGSLAGVLLVQLPLLIVLIAGFVLVASRRQRLGGRASGLALAGLGVFVVYLLLQVLWQLFLPTLVTRADLPVSQIGIVSSLVGFLGSGLFAAGLALLLAAPFAKPQTPPPLGYQGYAGPLS